MTPVRNNVSKFSLTVLMAAGGSGVRVGTPVPKQFLLLSGKPMYWYSLSLFLESPAVERVLLGLSSDRIPLVEQDLLQFFPGEMESGRILLYEGGRRRQDTVYRGISLLEREASKPDFLLVHDAARPFLSSEVMNRVVDTLMERVAIAVGIPLADTLWRENTGGSSATIEGLVSRESLHRAQTPQGAPFSFFVEARKKALACGDPDFTDEAGLLLFGGFSVRIVLGSEDNRKITTPDDLSWAENRTKKSGNPL